jgi:integrase
MRISEACGLGRSDVEPAARRLTIRRAKNGRSREIPLHPSTVTALQAYARVRDELCPDPLGHETLDSTNKYVHGDMELKRRALDRTTPTNTKPGRYRPPDRLLAFLESL